MKEITVENHVVPASGRSKNYKGGGGTVTVGGGGTTIIQQTTQGGATSTESEHAKEADHAAKADEATHAQTADKATEAEHAGATDHATEADHAGRADTATNADHADHATEADHAANADRAGYADKSGFADAAEHANTATHSDIARNLDEDSPDWNVIDDKIQKAYDFAGEQFISKTHDDTAKGKITFEDFITLVAGVMLGNARIVKATQSGQEITADDDAIVSAAKMLGTFLRKDQEDETKYLLRLTGGAIFAMLKTADYNPGGLMGAGLGLFQDETGKWCIETDKLYVRVKAIFEELEIRRLSVVNGNILLTPAGSVLTGVTDKGDYWRCFYKADDGTMATTNSWRVGDQARCQTFNIKAGVYQNVSNRYWWRLVVGCGDGYVDISKADADTDSDTPAAGDVVIQLGNRTDAERQHAIMLATVDVGAPAITQYAGIKSYTLSGCVKTRISPNGNVFTGDFYLNDGRSVIQVIDGKITSVISETVRQQTDKDNYLTNGSFGENLDGWEYASGTRLFKAGGRYIKAAAAGQLSNKGTGAAWCIDDGHPVCYIGESQIKQLAANYASKPTPATDKAGTKQGVPIRLTLYYKVLADGQLTINFANENKAGFNDFESFGYKNTLTADGGYKMLEVTGYWSATGDFQIAFSGQIYIHSVVLWLNEYTYYETRITQTAREIRLEALEISQRVDGLTERTGTLEVTARNITARVEANERNIDGVTNRVGSLEVTAESVTARVTATETNIGGLTTRVGILETTADSITARVTANESNISGNTSRIGALEVRAGAIELSVTETNGNVDALATRVGTLEVTADSITQRVSDAETTIKGHTTKISTLETTASNITARVASVEDAASTNGSDIVTLRERVGTLETTSTSVTARVSSLETTTSGHTESIAALQVTANGLTSRVQKLAGSNILSGVASGTGWMFEPRKYVRGYDSDGNALYTALATLRHTATAENYEFYITARYKDGNANDSYSGNYSDAVLYSPAVRVKTYTKYTLSFGLYLVGRPNEDWSYYKSYGTDNGYVRSWLHVLGGTSAAGATNEIINNWTYRMERVAVYDEGSYLRYKVTFSTSNYTYIRLKFWCRLFSADGTNYGYWYIRNPQLEIGENATQFNAAETLAESWVEQTAESITAKLKDNTGIDINTGKVTVTANKFVVQTTSGQKSLVASDGKVNIDLLNATEIVTNGINAQTIDAGSATFKNLRVTGKSVFGGSVQNPFSIISNSSDIDYNDNVVVLSSGTSWGTSYNLQWTVSQSGRLIRMVNYRWGSSYASGYASISAPSGKYFFEDGIKKTSIKMSREVIELLGYGTASEFYGWIVLKRVDIDTVHKYGRYARVLAMGTVGKASGNNVTLSYRSYDGKTLTGEYVSTGQYKVKIPTDWNVESGELIVMATALYNINGDANSNPLYAGVATIESNTSGVVTSFTVQCGDDDSRNDGTVQFVLYNRADWIYVS